MSRRLFLPVLTLALLLAAALPVCAAEGPTQTIEHAVNEVMDIMKSPDMHDQAKRSPLLTQIENKVKTIFDFEEFAARTVGPNWRDFTPEQQKRFIHAFASLLRATYIEKLENYDGEKVNYTGEVLSSKGDKAEVQTTVQIKDKNVPVAYRMLLKDGAWKVYDVRIEKISLIENYRGQFKELLLKGDAEALITKVESKAEEIRKQNQSSTPK